jgi:hypothetical protein
VDCNCLAVTVNAALSDSHSGQKRGPFPATAEKAKNVPHPPREKITFTVVSTSTGSLLSR